MDERIDLTENRDFRSRDDIPKNGFDVIQDGIWSIISHANRLIRWESIEDLEYSYPHERRRKIAITSSGSVCINSVDEHARCACCGKKIIEDYMLCTDCERRLQTGDRLSNT